MPRKQKNIAGRRKYQTGKQKSKGRERKNSEKRRKSEKQPDSKRNNNSMKRKNQGQYKREKVCLVLSRMDVYVFCNG
jgi:hypothetical protein